MKSFLVLIKICIFMFVTTLRISRQETTSTTVNIETSSTTNTTTNTTTTTISITTTTNLPVSNIERVKSYLGPRKQIDIVFLLSRNRGLMKEGFYKKSRPLTMSLLKKYATVHKDYARVAYVTFANDSSVDYDGISGNEDPIDKCTMFPSFNATSFPLDSVVYKHDVDFSLVGINDAIDETNRIFETGRVKRPNVKQLLIIITDADFKKNIVLKPINPAPLVVGVGYGVHYEDQKLKGLMPSGSIQTKYDEWKDLKAQFTSPLYKQYPSISYCSSLTSGLPFEVNKTDCLCDVDHGVLEVKCKDGYVHIVDEDKNQEYCEEKQRSCPSTNCTICRIKNGVCEENVIECKNYCSNKGVCQNTNNKVFCQCVDSYFGLQCSFKANDCRFPQLCGINGTCRDGICECSKKYYGTYCEFLVQTTVKPVLVTLNPVFSFTAAVIASSVVGGIILIVIVLGLIICMAIHILRQKNKEPYKAMTHEMGTGTEGSVSKWSAKSRNNLSVRLSKLWKQRSLRGFKEQDGMPSVPWKANANLTNIELQNLDQEETIVENETIHDNRPVMENWKVYLGDLIEEGTITKGMMVNVFTKDIITTHEWDFNWSEVYTLDTIFGTDTNVTVQDEDYFLKAPVEGVASGKSGSQFSDERQTLVAVAKTKKYLIAAIVALSESQDGSECITEVRSIMNHVKAEGY